MLDRRRVLAALAGLFFAGVGTGGYAFAWEPEELAITRYRLTPRGWPPGGKLRIVALSDIHVGGYHMPLSRLPRIVAAANALQPDLVLLLGDFIASRPPRSDDPAMADWARELAQLRSPNGIYAILGNHDWWHDKAALKARGGPTLVGQALDAVGIRVLENEVVRVEGTGNPFWLAGLGDQIAFQTLRLGSPWGVDDLPATLAQIPEDGAPVIMMAHEPDAFHRMPERVSLTLSGHTHGGQIRLFGWSPVVPSRYGNRYAYGHVQEQGRDLIVSGGLGTSKLPVRFGVPPEIVLVELG